MSEKERSRLTNSESSRLCGESSIRWNKTIRFQRFQRLVERLVAMTLPELAQRIRNQVRKLPLLQQRSQIKYQSAAIRCATDFHNALGLDRRKTIVQNLRRNFFLCPDDKQALTKLLRSEFSDHVEQTIQQADALLTDGIDILGNRFRVNPDGIDWHADPETGEYVWPDRWFDEAFATNLDQADVKYVWEINRHQILTTLGRAFWYTDDQRYRNSAIELISDWIDKNPPGSGVNWCSHLEVAMRAISWLWSMPFLLMEDSSEDEFLDKWLGSISHHYYHLSQNLSVYTDPTNHLIGEATALWMLSVVLPDLPRSAENASKSMEQLLNALEQQTHADGVNKEQAASYHRFVLDFYLQVLVLSDKNGRPLSEGASAVISRMLEFAASLCGKHGIAPMIGDSDDARGVPFVELVGWNFRDLMSTGSVIFGRSSWKALSEKISPISVWMLGTKALNVFNSLSDESPGNRSKFFPSGGYCFLSNFSEQDDAELIFNCGDLGLWPNAAHGHADALSIQIRIKNRFLICDLGTGAYFHSRRIRDYFRKTSSHNTLTIDEVDQADIIGTFKWVNPFQIQDRKVWINDQISFCSARQSGYQRLDSPANHTRSILSIRSLGWIVIDCVDTNSSHSSSRRFHFHPACHVSQLEDGSILAMDGESGGGIRLRFSEVTSAGDEKTLVSDNSLYSDSYGVWEQTSSVVCTTKNQRYLLTLVEPTTPSSDSNLNSEILTQELDNGAILYTILRSGNSSDLTEVLLNPRRQKILLNQNVSSDAIMTIMRRAMDGSVRQALIVGDNSEARSPAFHISCGSGDQFAMYDVMTK